MCGITGMFGTGGAPVDRAVMESMTRTLAHRGPDGQGILAEGSIGLGHRRLAIIDLTDAGRQPMETPDGNLAITYSGEAYNFLELRAELEALGHAFQSRTDTEVVLHAYQEWGTASVKRLNGMFAFAIWDRRRNELFLARDRYGIKPLYHARIGRSFVFSSEIKAFLRVPGFAPRLSLPHLLEYFTFQNIFTDGTFFDGVNLLPAGHWMRIRSDAAPEVMQYWDFDFANTDDRLTPTDYADELRRLLDQAVRRQLVSDVPVGAYLSGGTDSAGITALAAPHIPYLSTFTGGFDLTSASGLELGFDERAKAEALSYRFKTEHYEVVLKAGDMERCLTDLVWHLEDPRVGQSYPNYYVARLASKFVKVVLAGTGGDELFGGYPWRYYIGSPDNHGDYVTQYYESWNRLVPPASAARLFQTGVAEITSELRPMETFRGVFPSGDPPPQTPGDYINHALYFEAKTFLHGLLLVEDKLSMAHGLETRVPFLDNDLVDFAQSLPAHLKIRDFASAVRLDENDLAPKMAFRHRRTRDGKVLLREALRTYVPDAVVEQTKQGFSGPDATWFRGESVDFVNRFFQDDGARVYEYLRPDTVRELLAEHTSGRHNRRLFIWSLLMLENWLRVFMDPRAADVYGTDEAAPAIAQVR
jgi:asparagine synthase (glutamine-hydrolysing)